QSLEIGGRLALSVFLRDEKFMIWREVASMLVPVGVLSILFFTLLGRGQYVGEGSMQYLSFLTYTLVGLGICSIIYHTVMVLERAFSLLKTKGKIAFYLARIVLLAPIVPLVISFFMLRNAPWSAVLILTILITMCLFLVFYARKSFVSSLNEIYFHVLLPFVLFFLFLGIVVFEVDAFEIFFLASVTYFTVRPFLNHLIHRKRFNN
ncbi:MAG: hypothetical protein KGZ57_07550, partial [Dethiobacter sp.]|nr:hypothetical protein [Dethiobacter sp.]